MSIFCRNISDRYNAFRKFYEKSVEEVEFILRKAGNNDSVDIKSFGEAKVRYNDFLAGRRVFLEWVDPTGILFRQWIAKSYAYDYVSPLNDEMFVVQRDGMQRLIDVDNNPISDEWYNAIEYGGPNWWRIYYGDKDRWSMQMNILRSDGTLLFDKPVYTVSKLYDDGVADVNDSENRYFIKSDGSRVDNQNFAGIGEVNNGIACVFDGTNSWYHLDLKTMRPLLPDQSRRFIMVFPFVHGIARVQEFSGTRDFYIDTSGNKLFADKEFEAITDFFPSGVAMVKDLKILDFCYPINTKGESLWGEKRFWGPRFYFDGSWILITGVDGWPRGIDEKISIVSATGVERILFRMSDHWFSPKKNLCIYPELYCGEVWKAIYWKYGEVLSAPVDHVLIDSNGHFIFISNKDFCCSAVDGLIKIEYLTGRDDYEKDTRRPTIYITSSGREVFKHKTIA